MKDRSGSAALNSLLRRVAALALAGGILLHFVFVPSAHRPSDPPSRGGPATWPRALRESTRYGGEGGMRECRRLLRLRGPPMSRGLGCRTVLARQLQR
jgi:hypothetical protein